MSLADSTCGMVAEFLWQTIFFVGHFGCSRFFVRAVVRLGSISFPEPTIALVSRDHASWRRPKGSRTLGTRLAWARLHTSRFMRPRSSAQTTARSLVSDSVCDGLPYCFLDQSETCLQISAGKLLIGRVITSSKDAWRQRNFPQRSIYFSRRLDYNEG